MNAKGAIIATNTILNAIVHLDECICTSSLRRDKRRETKLRSKNFMRKI